MKNLCAALFCLVLFDTGCEQSMTFDPEQNGPLVHLHRGAEEIAQIEASPPSGTQYGTGNSTWTASGSEYLEDDYWVRNTQDKDFGVDIFGSVCAHYEDTTTINISSPIGVTYRHVTEGWKSLTSAASVTTDSVRTDSTGSCSIEGSDEVFINNNDGNVG